LKNKPEKFPKGEFSLFLEKLIKEGYEVEEYDNNYFQMLLNFLILAQKN
jgi:hypothetical protein